MTDKKLMIKKSALEQTREISQGERDKKRAAADTKWDELQRVRREKAEAHQRTRDEEKAKVKAAKDADVALAVIVSEHNSLADARKVLEEAENRRAVATVRLRKAAAAFSDAYRALARVQDEEAQARSRALRGETSLVEVRSCMEASDAAWAKFGRQFRKKNRDRTAKKAATEILKK